MQHPVWVKITERLTIPKSTAVLNYAEMCPAAPPPLIKSKFDSETAPVTPVRGPRFMELGSWAI